MCDANATGFQSLSAEPVLGQAMGNVTVLRLDRTGGAAPGNKVFKLRRYLEGARERGLRRVLSFGGPWSNHLHALAALGSELGLETVGFVRGGEAETPTLADALAWGMRLVPLSRTKYRRRGDAALQRELLRRYGPGLLIPEGGGGRDGVLGCLDIAQVINTCGRDWSHVLVAVGTGTTLAGLAAGLRPGNRLLGVSALRNASDLEQRVQQSLRGANLSAAVPWRIEHGYHCGGFARASDALCQFMLDFEQVHQLPLEPVYTGKLFFAVFSEIAAGRLPAHEPLLLIHTGGLQGRRGYDWLSNSDFQGY